MFRARGWRGATARLRKHQQHDDRGAVLYTLSPLSHNLVSALVTALAAGGELVVYDLARGKASSTAWRKLALSGVPTRAIDLLAEMRAGSAGSQVPASASPGRRRRRSLSPN
jgi:hypothetical protein